MYSISCEKIYILTYKIGWNKTNGILLWGMEPEPKASVQILRSAICTSKSMNVRKGKFPLTYWRHKWQTMVTSFATRVYYAAYWGRVEERVDVNEESVRQEP